MSQGGTKREQQRTRHKELRAKLTSLELKPGDVLVIEVREDLFDDEDGMKQAQEFANAVAEEARRAVFVVREGYKLTAVPDPRSMPDLAVPKPNIYLPEGVKPG